MFYANFILAKKGPLAKIWLAAHWESKLSKAQIQETDLSNAANEIAKPKVKIALRTCGYLLLGLMRIFCKKGYFLYNDCKEAVLRLKTNLNPGTINWEKEEMHVAEAVGQDAVMPDFDVTHVNVDISGLNQPHFEQLPIDQITLNDDNFIEPDRPVFGHDDFGEIAAGLVEEPINQSIVEGARRSSRANSVGSLIYQPVNLREEVPPKDSNANQFEFGTDSDLDKLFNNLPPLESTRISDEMEVEQPVATQDSFALEPIEENKELVIKKAPIRKRKRKLIVDDFTSISNNEMMSNINDYSDIVYEQVDLAPPTKSLMKIREVGTVEKLLVLPCASDNLNEALVRIYSSHLSAYRVMPLEKRPLIGPDQEEMDNISSIGERSAYSGVENMRFSLQSFGFEAEADEFPLELPPLEQIEYDIIPQENISEQGDLPPAKGNALHDITNQIINSQPLESYDLDNISVADLISQSPTQFKENFNAINRQRNLDEKADTMLEPTAPGVYKKKRGSNIQIVDKEESEFDPNELRFTRQTQNVFDAVTLRLKNSVTTSMFSLLSKNSTTKSAAQKFYSILVLAKHNAIDVHQTLPYENIRITKGVDYEKCLTRIDEFRK